MTVIEITYKNRCIFLWIESYSQLTNLVFRNTSLFPWSIRNRLLNYIEMVKSMSFTTSHIYREENRCVEEIYFTLLTVISEKLFLLIFMKFSIETILIFLNIDFIDIYRCLLHLFFLHRGFYPYGFS